MSKIDFKKEFKDLYETSSKEVRMIDLPAMNYLMIEGEGDPNTSKEYKDAVQALFSLSYSIKFMIKKGEQGIDYGVMPLEGLWWADDMNDFMIGRKDGWKWTSMIMQPKLITNEIVEKAIKDVAKKKDLPALYKVKFEIFEEKLCSQIMHIGPFSEEGATISRLHNFISEKGYIPIGKHHEIYISDFNKTAPERLKTIIRQPITPKV